MTKPFAAGCFWARCMCEAAGRQLSAPLGGPPAPLTDVRACPHLFRILPQDNPDFDVAIYGDGGLDMPQGARARRASECKQESAALSGSPPLSA